MDTKYLYKFIGLQLLNDLREVKMERGNIDERGTLLSKKITFLFM